MHASAVQCRLLIDGHLHLYPSQDWSRMVTRLLANLRLAAGPEPGGIVVAGLLAESRGSHFYRDAVTQAYRFRADSLRLEAGPEEGTLAILENGQIQGYLVAGRQIVTSEKLELLGLCQEITVPDGLPAGDTLDRLHEQGALAVLSWSPGKWFFERGRVVRQLIENGPASRFLVGDTAMRPRCWPMPGLMRRARERGFGLIAGSDPLPLAGEESLAGSYGFEINARFDPACPATSLRQALAASPLSPTLVGCRRRSLDFLSRWIRNQARRR